MSAPEIDQVPVAAQPTRDALVDNVRAVLIVSVIAGHLANAYHDQAFGIGYLHYFIYLFHMPAFAFASGYVTRSPQHAARTAIRALLPIYLGFSVVHLVVRSVFFGTWEWSIFVGPGLLWYLLALLFWRLLLPVFDALRHPVIIALILSLLAGLTERLDTTLTSQRVFVFLPMFLMGHYARNGAIERIRKTPWIVGPTAIAVIATVAWYAAQTGAMKLALLNGNKPYPAIDGPMWAEMTGRVVIVVTTLCAVVAMFRMLPRSKTFYTHLGQYSLGVYVLHMYFIYAFQLNYPTLGAGVWPAVAVLLSSIPIAFFLATPPVRAVVSFVETTARRGLDALMRPEALQRLK